MRTFGLAELLHPLSTREFMAKYWQKQPYVRHGSPQRFHEIAEIPALRSIEAILEVWHDTAEAWAPRDTKNPLIKAEAHQLSDFFESGYTLYLSHVEEHVPALVPFARRLELDLGLRGDEVFFEAFVSKGAGSEVHFDPNVTINIQLIGSKQWQSKEYSSQASARWLECWHGGGRRNEGLCEGTPPVEDAERVQKLRGARRHTRVSASRLLAFDCQSRAIPVASLHRRAAFMG